MELEKLIESAEEKINLGTALISDLKDLSNVDGVNKVERKIKQEIKFLEKVKKCRFVRFNVFSYVPFHR